MRLRTIGLYQAKPTWLHRQLSLLVAIVGMTMVTLACAFLGSSSRPAPSPVVILTRLPTLTRTPLPTLTPTPAAAAMSTEADVISPSLVPTSTGIPASQTAPGLAEPAIPTPPPAVAPANGETSASLTAENQGGSGPVLTTLVGLNVRAGPGLEYAVVGQLAQGQSAQISGMNPEGTWWQIVYPPGSGGLAWASANAQYSLASNVDAVQMAQLPPPPPTAIPTAAPIAQLPPPPVATETPAAQLLPTPTPVSNPTTGPTTTPISASSGWAFAGVRVYTDQYEDGLLLYGNLINHTGSSQELVSIMGTFYDAQGQVIADADRTYAYWPAYVIPPDGGMPFELTVDDVDSAANFNFSAEAEPSGETPRQDFEFSNVNQWSEDNEYCLEGELRNAGGGLQIYIIIAAILYDVQDAVVNFGDYTEYGPTQVVGDQTLDFEICVGSPNNNVVRYELRAWGQ